MVMIEYIMKDGVFIDFGSEIIYGSDQINLTYPIRFATVNFQLMATSLLTGIADRIRKDAGYRPMHPIDEYTDETCDCEGWYDFYITIDELPECRIDTAIRFVVVNADSPDNEESYSIDLDLDEQCHLYERLDEQCREHLGKSCVELLKEARAKMEKEAALESDKEERH